jgi:hypothetical protein
MAQEIARVPEWNGQVYGLKRGTEGREAFKGRFLKKAAR